MNKEISIKELVIKEHYAVISSLMGELHLNEKVLFERTAAWKDIEASYMRHLIEMQEEHSGTFLGAYHEGEMVGFIFGYLEEEDDSRIEDYHGDELYISDGFVLPDFRKQGIYKRLNEEIEGIYIVRGVRRITRFTLVNNEPMKTLLASQGYQPTRILFEKWL